MTVLLNDNAMKKILTHLFAASCVFSFAQQRDVICHTPSTEKFAMFASNREFNNEHQMPREYVHVSQAGGEMIKFKTPDGKEANAYVLKAKKATNNWIFVFQEGWEIGRAHV